MQDLPSLLNPQVWPIWLVAIVVILWAVNSFVYPFIQKVSEFRKSEFDKLRLEHEQLLEDHKMLIEKCNKMTVEFEALKAMIKGFMPYLVKMGIDETPFNDL